MPVTFNLDAMCRTARRRISKTIDAAVERDLAAIAADFQRARRVRGLPPIVLLAWKVYTLPHPRYSCPECDGRVCFEVDEWSISTGMPTVGGIRVMCVAEEQEFDRAMQADEDPAWKHQHWQDPGWMGLHRQVERFCASNVRIAR